MVLSIRLADSKNGSIEMYEKLGLPIHKSLVGNIDYIESNIILNLDKDDNIPSCSLLVAAEYCHDKEYIREKLKNAIDLFIDNV
jgi:hypothetical protein